MNFYLVVVVVVSTHLKDFNKRRLRMIVVVFNN